MGNQETVKAAAPRKSKAWLWWLTGLMFIVATLVGLMALVFGWHEPKYSDKSLSYWLAELNGTNYVRREIAADALAKIGKPALEPLKHALHKERSFVYELRDKVWKISPPSIQQHIPKPWAVDDLQYNACVGLAAMGLQAESVAPDLVLMLTNSSAAIKSRATYALRKMGTNAHPALLEGIASTNAGLVIGSHAVLENSGIRLPLGLKAKAQLQHFLEVTTITPADLGKMFGTLRLSADESAKLLSERLGDESETKRVRAAILLAQLDVASEKITAVLVKGISSGSAVEKNYCVTGLLKQGEFLRAHREELEKIVPKEVPTLSSFLNYLDGRFGFSTEKWASIDQMIASGDFSQQTEAATMLEKAINRREGKERVLGALKTLLASTNEMVVTHVVRQSGRYFHPLLPEIEKLAAQLASRPETDPLRVETEQVLGVMKTSPVARLAPPMMLPSAVSTNFPNSATRALPQRPSRVSQPPPLSPMSFPPPSPPAP
ncbi:MAG: hypothetical protein K0Q55_1889 [Verrucomicrobia bacterium]|nr:hypothetical protein [Verrucomicrobiota bacterium]